MSVVTKSLRGRGGVATAGQYQDRRGTVMSSTSGRAQRIAHLSDVHLLDDQRRFDLRCRFVSVARPLDAALRVKKLLLALRAALRAGADHVIISGDLTEMGTDKEFERFAEVLHDAHVDPDAVTLVPGNHDAYTAPDGWRRALQGPLAAFARGSAETSGKVVERRGFLLLPLDVTRHQSVARSGGELTEQAAHGVESRLKDAALADRPVVVVQHHPPFGNPRSPWHFIDGLTGYARMLKLMITHPRVHVLHGHAHRTTDRVVPPVAPTGHVLAHGVRAPSPWRQPRVFGAPAVVEDSEGTPRVRLYEVRDGCVHAAGLAA